MTEAVSEVRPIGQFLADIKAAQVLKVQQVCSLTGLSRASLYRLGACNQFPKPVKIGIRASGWRLSEIQAWLDSRESAVRFAA